MQYIVYQDFAPPYLKHLYRIEKKLYFCTPKFSSRVSIGLTRINMTLQVE